MSVAALVLSAGHGTRLGALTRDLPKPLLPIGGEPLVAHTLALLARHGVHDVTINLHFQAEKIRDALSDGARYGVSLRYVEETTLLGTAGSTAQLAHDRAEVTDLLVVYGDLLFDHDLTSMLARHRANHADATLLVHWREVPSNSVVEIDEVTQRIRSLRERPKEWPDGAPGVWVNSGCQLIRRSFALEFPAPRPLDLPRDVYAPMAASHALYAEPLTGYRIAIDSPERYQRAIADHDAGLVRAARA